MGKSKGMDAALEAILDDIAHSFTIGDRKSSLDSLKRAISSNVSGYLDSLDKKSWQKIFDAIFQTVANDKIDYHKDNKTQKGRAHAHLLESAKTVRCLVEVAVSKVGFRTIKGLLEHIIDVLPTAEGMVEPLAKDYLRTMRYTLECRSHVEHLRDTWRPVLSFCIDGLNHLQSVQHDNASNSSKSGVHSSDNSTFPSSSTRAVRSSQARHEADELVACIRLLHEASNASVQMQASQAIHCLVGYLELITSYGRAHLDALSGINSILERVSQADLELTYSTIKRLMPSLPTLWSYKSSQLRDEILRFLIITRLHQYRISQDAADEPFYSAVGDLLSTLHKDYSQRSSRDQLHLEDIELATISKRLLVQVPISRIFVLRTIDEKADAQLTCVYFIAFFSMLMDDRRTKSLQESRLKQDNGHKRARLTTHLEEYIRSCYSSSAGNQICTMQVIAVRLMFKSVSADELETIIAFAIDHSTGSDALVTSWTHILLAYCARQTCAVVDQLNALWQQAWQLCCGAVTHLSTSRAACFLLTQLIELEVVNVQAVSASLTSMLQTSEIAGPAVLTDTSIQLWFVIVSRKVAENPGLSAALPSKLLQWLFTKWSPSALDSRVSAFGEASNISAREILRFIEFCTGHQLVSNKCMSIQKPKGLVAQAWIRHDAAIRLLSYLMLLGRDIYKHYDESLPAKADARPLRSRPDSEDDTMIIEYCQAEARKSAEKFREVSSNRNIGVTNNTIRLVTDQCLVYDHVRAMCLDRSGRKRDELRKASRSLSSELMMYLSRIDVEQSKLDTCLISLADFVPSALDIMVIGSRKQSYEQFDLMLMISRILEQDQSMKSTIVAGNASVSMELDDGFDSQASDSQHNMPNQTLPRDNIATLYSIVAFRKALRQGLLFLVSVVDASESYNDMQVPPSFIEQLAQLSPHDLCLCWSIVRDIFQQHIEIDSSELTVLFERITVTFLEDYHFERCETALMICLDLLNLTAERWVALQTDGAGLMAREILDWFLTRALSGKVVSNSVEIYIVELCFRLVELRGPEYKSSDDASDIREYIMQFLDRDLVVMFHTSGKISMLFHHFTLGEHEGVLNAVWKCLPIDPEQYERMALRLHAFACLAAEWQTLLRRCVYHIFETAGKFPMMTDFAKLAVQTIAAALGVQHERQIFVLFASQLLYSWMAEQRVRSIPFAIFGFASLEALLLEVEDEIVAQVFLRVNDVALADTTEILGKTAHQLVCENFGRTVAYCFAQDSENKRKGQKSISLEVRLMQSTGDKQFVRLFQALYPQILSTVLLLLNGDMEEKLLRQFQTYEKTDLKYAHDALLKMRGLSESLLLLPPDQQPAFHTKGLVDSIHKIMRRSGRSFEHLWSAPVYVFVLRAMLQRLNPCLGSLHACSVMRKVRVLVALAGKSASAGYPLEMTLHALRPFLTDQQCANDASGIVQYLLASSKPALAQAIPFVSGYVTAVVLSLRRFSTIPHDSTTQERDHQATVSRAANFRKWIVQDWYPEYATMIKGQNAIAQNVNAFCNLVQAAIAVQSQANADTSTPESDLLKMLLTQTGPDNVVLTTDRRLSILRLFCDEFREPKSSRDDVFGEDSMSIMYASEIWQSCVELDRYSDDFLLWAGKVIGRARLADNWTKVTRPIHGAISTIDADMGDEGETLDIGRASKSLIIHAIMRLISSDDNEHVGLAEDAIRDLLLQAEDSSTSDNFMSELPLRLKAALYLTIGVSTVKPKQLSIKNLQQVLATVKNEAQDWLLHFALAIVAASSGGFLKSLTQLLYGVTGLAEKLLAPIVHVALCEDLSSGHDILKSMLSEQFSRLFGLISTTTAKNNEALLQIVLYLRQKPRPGVSSIDKWEAWLNIDMMAAAEAAEFCGMHSAALLFSETKTRIKVPSAGPGSQRRLATHNHVSEEQMRIPHDLLLSIYRSIDEPDSFYGVHRSTSLSSVVDRLDYENDGIKSLLFHSAQLDSSMRQQRDTKASDMSGILLGLSRLNLNSVSHAVLRGQQTYMSSTTLDEALNAARRLEQWDLSVPESLSTAPAVLFRVFQTMYNVSELQPFKDALNAAVISQLRHILQPSQNPKAVQTSLSVLGVLTELDEIVSCRSLDNLTDVLERMRIRDLSLSHASSEEASRIQSARDTAFSMLAQRKALQGPLNISEKDARSIQVRSLLNSCSFAQREGANFESLSSATYLANLIPICRSAGLRIEAEAQEMIADILWAQGEQTTSIYMLETLAMSTNSTKTLSEDLTRATVLAKLGHHIGDARLETSAQITQRYLQPAFQSLKGLYQGEKPGKVLHEFAAFCDRELRNPNLMEEYKRLTETRARRKKEVELHHNLAKSAKSKADRDKLTRDAKIAARWFKIDGEEFDRVISAREALIQQCIENYVRSLAAWDEQDSDVLRLFSIWLEHSHHESINQIVANIGDSIPSAKFAVLISQLTSLLQEDRSNFITNLKSLILRICLEHPHHSLHHIFAALNNNQQNDGPAASRKLATEKIVESMRADPKARDRWNRFWQADTMYHALAIYTDRSKISSGKEMPLDRLSPSATLIAKIKSLRVPPATMDIALRKDCDYSSVPVTTGFRSRMTIASGISAPKILTAMASDGKSYKQLYKAGNDDLRQDAIMEQVFDQVSQLLKKSAATRQRRLQIRTYKVLPLSGNSGIIEFVPNTVPLSDFLQPAHQRYYPSDWSWSRCREKLHSIAQQTNDAKAKLKVYREIEVNFHPVLRYFFLERFADPDEWFQRRLAYTRSTAAISMLGHVLGLGDRHCHNILLDQKSGEAVHIDLGIAFEAGRILPVPEVVPFRLSRDIVDGFGVTKTEGVFRRCCQFTLDALRHERESIMTLLNVLRYDPLVNWTVSPLRAKRLQHEEPGLTGLMGSGQGAHSDDEGPAGRALGVVEKKLTQMMSTTATVSELIQQASDERNLAVLYSGWAPWA